MLQNKFGSQLRQEEFLYDPDAVLLNHGSYGGVPRRVLDVQRRLQETIEQHPDDWFRRKNIQHHKNSLEQLCKFIGTKMENTVFVENPTTGSNVVLKSLSWNPGDSILTSNLTFYSVKVMAKETAEVIQIQITFPIDSKQQILDKYEEALKANPCIKLVIIAHITSPSAVLMPVKELAELCHKYGVMIHIDGAHAAGQIPLKIEDLGVDFYTGNVHKWLFTPRGCGYLWIAPAHHSIIRPVVISHFHGVKLHYDFIVRGTRDDTPYHALPEALQFFDDLGGFDAITRYNHCLLEEAVTDMESSWGTERLAVIPDLQAPFMRLIRVPDMMNYDKTAIGGGELETDLYTRYNIQSLCMLVQGDLYIRLSAHVYNTTKDYQCLRDAVLELAKEPRQEKPQTAYDLPIMHWDLSPFA